MTPAELLFGFPTAFEIVPNNQLFIGQRNLFSRKIGINLRNPASSLHVKAANILNPVVTVDIGSLGAVALLLTSDSGGTSFAIDPTSGNLVITPANGQVTVASNLLASSLTVSTNIIATGSFGPAAGLGSANFYLGSASEIGSSSASNIIFLAASTTFFRSLFNGTNNNIGGGATSAGINFTSIMIATTDFLKATTGTHPMVAQIAMKPLTVSGSGSSVTATAGLYIEDASAATVTDANYSIFVDNGFSRFDGAVSIGSGVKPGTRPFLTLGKAATGKVPLNLISSAGTAPTSPGDGDIWYDGTNIKMRIGAATKTFTLT